MPVYFADRDGKTKIGRSRDPSKRAKSLSASLRHVFVAPKLPDDVETDRVLERWFHRYFDAEALGCEWFTCLQQSLVLASCAKCACIVTGLDQRIESKHVLSTLAVLWENARDATAEALVLDGVEYREVSTRFFEQAAQEASKPALGALLQAARRGGACTLSYEQTLEVLAVMGVDAPPVERFTVFDNLFKERDE